VRGIVAIVVLLLLFSPVAGSDLNKVIVVYAGGEPEFAEMLASVLESDSRLEAEIKVVHSTEEVIIAAAIPSTQCIVIYANHKDYVPGLGSTLVPFFEEGGGLVGITEVCYEPSVQDLARKVFPVFGNSSDVERSPRVTRTRTYIPEESSEISSGLPESFGVLSMGTYFSADEEGRHVRVPGDYTVAYRDNATGSPLVITHESVGGGRSVAFPGVMLVSIDRLDVYYGNIVSDENFVKLLTNSVAWAGDNGRIRGVEEGLAEKLGEYEDQLQRADEEAEDASRGERTGQMLTLLALWVVGLVSCGVVVKLVILAPVEPD
jgi:hypothetical protein